VGWLSAYPPVVVLPDLPVADLTEIPAVVLLVPPVVVLPDLPVADLPEIPAVVLLVPPVADLPDLPAAQEAAGVAPLEVAVAGVPCLMT